jgi:hypothetical protein
MVPVVDHPSIVMQDGGVSEPARVHLGEGVAASGDRKQNGAYPTRWKDEQHPTILHSHTKEKIVSSTQAHATLFHSKYKCADRRRELLECRALVCSCCLFPRSILSCHRQPKSSPD